MRLVLANATVVTGDGATVLDKASVVVEGDCITDVSEGFTPVSAFGPGDRVINAEGYLVIPGVINHHAHRTTVGPASAYGAPPPPREQVIANVNRHMLQGTTTILNVDGFVAMEDVEAINSVHPVNLKTGTVHFPSSFQTADLADGSGLTPKHRALRAEDQVAAGAVAIGECGAGGTLGGGSQDWLYIPKVIKEETGVEIEPRQARALKHAALGRYIDRAAFDPQKMASALEAARLTGVLTAERARHLIEGSVLPSFDIGLTNLRDATLMAKKLGVPVVLHNAAASKRMILDCAREYPIIAAHSNHDSFEIAEAVEHAKALKALGATVDVSSFDAFVARRLVDSPAHLFAMLQEGLVDTITTDYAGGHHDAILLALEKAIEAGVISLPGAIALATYNVTKAIPRLAPDRGLIAPGKVADLVMTDRAHMSQVHSVFIWGQPVVQSGQLVNPDIN
jgi:imidazolonepropionase-like amidohydrolase